MEKAVYIILILCGILSQGICHRSVSEGNNETSSNLLIRQKRVVGGEIRRFSTSPFILHVVENDTYRCPATLLTAAVAISSAACFINQNTQNMAILSRSKVGGQQYHHIVRVIFLDPHFNPAHPTVKNLALVRFVLPINFRLSENVPVVIYSGNLATDRLTTRVIGWARPHEVGYRRVTPDHFATFPVIISSQRHCQEVYPNMIEHDNVCAISSNVGEYCDTNTDTGVPLIKGNQLLGIFVYRCNSCQTRPNVFMNLLDHDIRHWIHEHVPSLHLF